MYKNFEEAKAAALEVIKKYGFENKGCCVTENKLRKNSRKTFFNFRFYSEDSNGEFIMNEDGTYSKLTAI